jgi:hypothetical protein
MKNQNRITRNLAGILLLALVTMACGVKLKSPLSEIKPGPSQTVDVEIPYTEQSTGIVLNLDFIAGDLKLAPGSNDQIVSGTAIYNAVELEPIIDENGSSYTLKAGNMKIEGMPVCPDDVTNSWDLKLANIPMSLNLVAGAYNGNLELGGLSLEKLSISEVGSTETVNFSKPNQVEMSSLTFSTGGSTLIMKGLANANFAQMDFNSGAGDYTLSFDGDLQRDASVIIKTGAATLTIIVPAGVNSQITYNGGLSSVNVEGGWTQNENIYNLSGSGPTITITVDLGLGTLNLKTK